MEHIGEIYYRRVLQMPTVKSTSIYVITFCQLLDSFWRLTSSSSSSQGIINASISSALASSVGSNCKLYRSRSPLRSTLQLAICPQKQSQNLTRCIYRARLYLFQHSVHHPVHRRCGNACTRAVVCSLQCLYDVLYERQLYVRRVWNVD